VEEKADFLNGLKPISIDKSEMMGWISIATGFNREAKADFQAAI